jgi:hypothetical protein
LKVAGSISDQDIGFFRFVNCAVSRTMTVALTQPQTEMSTRDLPEGKAMSARKADNLYTICESIV